MAFRAAAYWKSMVTNSSLRGGSTFTTSTSPKQKAYAPAVDQLLNPSKDFKARLEKGDFVPVCVAIGMIALSTSLGIYTGLHQLGRAPNVFVKKTRRETIPEVVEPEHVAEDADRFVRGSLFRKVAHLKDPDHQQVAPNPIVGDIFAKPKHVETLKDIGLDPKT